jgi:hypothetical protein
VNQFQEYAYTLDAKVCRLRSMLASEDSALDLVGAITLIATVVEDRTGQVPAPSDSLLAQCLIMAGARREEISDTLLRDFRQCYSSRQLPVEMTCDAAVVLYVAHRSTLLGSSDRAAFAAAVRVAGRISRRR